MGAVFVSYRREDSEGQARALSLELVKLLGKDAVFMDVDSIALGRDFRQILQERLGSCDVMVTLIGPGWLDAKDASGNRRLDSTTDYVRQEIAGALKRNIPVIPVLLQGAQLPPPERLPDDLQDLSFRNGFELGHATWESDVREMVKRLGLLDQKATTTAPPSTGTQVRTPARTVPATPGRFQRGPLIAAAAVIAGIALLVALYPKTQDSGQPATHITPLSQPSGASAGGTAGRSSGAVRTAALPAATSGAAGAIAASALEFNWPGGDCWDIFRGAELVTYQCGAKSQALEAGRYTIKAKNAPVFLPFEVTVKPGVATPIALGGVIDFNWPGGDCWDIFRGNELVTYQCGAKKQALQAGSYTIKGKNAPVFLPFEAEIKNGSATRIELGGTFSFSWPGGDCWDIFRGEELVTYQCGAKQQALGAGTYTIKGKNAPVFKPFTIQLANGAEVKAP